MLKACIAATKFIIMHAANTGLTRRSTPGGSDYERDMGIELIPNVTLAAVDLQMAKSEGFVTVWIQRPRLKAKCLSSRWSRLLPRIDRVDISGLYKFLGTGMPLAFGS